MFGVTVFFLGGGGVGGRTADKVNCTTGGKILTLNISIKNTKYVNQVTELLIVLQLVVHSI